jgi:hypothetical protein
MRRRSTTDCLFLGDRTSIKLDALNKDSSLEKERA